MVALGHTIRFANSIYTHLPFCFLRFLASPRLMQRSCSCMGYSVSDHPAPHPADATLLSDSQAKEDCSTSGAHILVIVLPSSIRPHINLKDWTSEQLVRCSLAQQVFVNLQGFRQHSLSKFLGLRAIYVSCCSQHSRNSAEGVCFPYAYALPGTLRILNTRPRPNSFQIRTWRDALLGVDLDLQTRMKQMRRTKSMS